MTGVRFWRNGLGEVGYNRIRVTNLNTNHLLFQDQILQPRLKDKTEKKISRVTKRLFSWELWIFSMSWDHYYYCLNNFLKSNFITNRSYLTLLLKRLPIHDTLLWPGPRLLCYDYLDCCGLPSWWFLFTSAQFFLSSGFTIRFIKCVTCVYKMFVPLISCVTCSSFFVTSALDVKV